MKNFGELSKAEQRVEIAKDVVEQISIKKYRVNAGYYVTDIELTDISDLADLDIKSNFEKIKNCTVCALGACILSITKYKNQLTFNDVDVSPRQFTHSEKIFSPFDGMFSPEQLLLIECAFENGGGMESELVNRRYSKDNYNLYLTDEQNDMTKAFYSKYNDSEQRLLAIMTNIIANNGEFILQ